MFRTSQPLLCLALIALVLSVVALCPAPASAKKLPTHGRQVAQPTRIAQPAHGRVSRRTAPSRGSAARSARGAKGREPDVRSAAVSRVSRREDSRNSNRRRQNLHRQDGRNPGPRQATARDFLTAAAETHSTPAHESTVHQLHSQPATAAAPIPVLAVIRPTANPPQLESIPEAAAEPIVLPALYNKRGRLVMPAPLFGSREILLHQNEVADLDGLGRIQNDEDLLGMRQKRMLVALPESDGLHVDDRLPTNRRFARPWTTQFLEIIARAHYARFHTPLVVTSAVRTVEFQQRLQRTNGNAAPADGDTASPHLTGQAVDIGKHGLSLTEIAWMRGYLLPLIQENKIDVEEEFQQSCFHISVYRKYLPPAINPLQHYAVSSHNSDAALATALR